MMRTLTSGISTNPARLISQISLLKGKQDDTTARMGSDTVAVMGTSDPDFYGFVTPTFQQYKPVTVGSGNGLFGTIALLPESQHATLEDRYYAPGTPFVMDRAGTASTGFNILRGGPPPAGYYGGQKKMVQKRLKRYFNDTTSTGFKFIYEPEVRREAKDYALQVDERLDGDFYPGSIYLGINRPFGWTFSTDESNRMQYSGNPFIDAGWDGSLNTVPNNPATKPVIDSISPDTFELGSGGTFLNIYGHNFQDCGFVLVGPFKPMVSVGVTREPEQTENGTFGTLGHNYVLTTIEPDGAYYYRDVSEDGTFISLVIPGADWVAGTFDIIVIGNDGQIARLEGGFTITDPVTP
jgi:hypothetical protein